MFLGGFIAFLYSKALRQAAIRVSAIVGATTAAKQAAYITAPLTATQVGTVDFPLAAIQDAIISNVARIIRTYASIPNHPLRNYHTNTTANIAHRGNIPSVDSGSLPIIGVYGAIRDATDFKELTEQPIQIIEPIVTNTDTFLKGSYYHYKIIGRRLYHTRTNATIDVVCFDEATERAALASGNCPLADGLFDIAWAGTVALLMIDSAYTEQAQIHEQYVQNALSQMSQGASEFASAPSLTNTNSPGVS